MIFSPLVVVATGIYLASASPLQPRFDLTQRAAYADPHAGPSVPANHTFTAADGGVAWKEAFEKARSIVEQMTLAEKVNITSGVVGPCVGNTGEVSRFNIPSLCLEEYVSSLLILKRCLLKVSEELPSVWVSHWLLLLSGR